MKKLAFFTLTLLLSQSSWSQSESKISSEEINFVMLDQTSSKTIIYYGDGSQEIVPHVTKSEATKIISGADEENVTLAMILNKFITAGWKISSIESTVSSMETVPKYYYLIK